MSVRLFILALAIVALALVHGARGQGVPEPRPNVILLA